MDNNTIKLPFYAKFSLTIIGLAVLVTGLYIARSIIVPLIFASLIATMLQPMVTFFMRLRINRVVAIVVSMLVAFLVIALLGMFIASQATRLTDSFPVLIEKISLFLNDTIKWIAGIFDVRTAKVNAWIDQRAADLLNSSGAEIGKTLMTVGSAVILLFIMPVYIFMILFYQPLLLEFFHRLFGRSNREEVSAIIFEIKLLLQNYLIGLLIELAIIATLYSTGLLILGIEYAIMLGIIGALLNLIPYVGAIIAASMPMLIALITKPSPWFALLVLGLYVFIQFIDNNYLLPKIVGSKVKMNALFTIIGVIIGNALWGIPGMFLSIPMLAILKLIFDHIRPLEPWGYLLGDVMPESTKVKPFVWKLPFTTQIKKKKK